MDADTAAAAAKTADADAARLKRLARDGQGAALLAELVALRDDSNRSELARTRLLHDGVLALATLKADNASRQFVEQLTSHPVTVRVWHSEGQHQASVPLYDVAAAAKVTLRVWNRTAVREAAVERALHDGPLVPADWLRSGRDDERIQAVVEAVDALPAAILQRQREAMARLIEQHPYWAPAVTAAAARLEDSELFVAVVRRAESGAAVRALPKITALPDSARALALLRTAAQRPAVASAALFEASRLARRDTAAVEWLFDMLGDADHGGSAAAAIARLDDPAVEGRLVHLLNDTNDEELGARAALALWLSGTNGAHDALRAYADDDRPSALKRQIAQWTAP